MPKLYYIIGILAVVLIAAYAFSCNCKKTEKSVANYKPHFNKTVTQEVITDSQNN